MKRSTVYLLMAVFAFTMIGCEQKANNASKGDVKEMSKNVDTAAEKLKSSAKNAVETVEKQVDKLSEETKKLEEAKKKVSALVNEAKDLLTKSKFEEAVAKGKEALGLDPSNTDAKNVIQKAMDSIKKMAAEKAEAITESADKTVTEMKEKLPTLGN